MSAENCGHCEDCEKLKKVISELIEILLRSGTASHHRGCTHDHALFDMFDRNEIKTLKKKLN